MKVIFLDVDGVLNSDASLMTDDALEEALILNLKQLVEQTNAKIILSSAWRMCPGPLRTLMDWLDRADLHLSGMTPNGVRVDWLKEQGYTPTRKYLDVFDDYNGNEYEVTTDRGAEICKWLADHKDVESFVILDDEAVDIIPYFPNNFIKTDFRVGLTEEKAREAFNILWR